MTPTDLNTSATKAKPADTDNQQASISKTLNAMTDLAQHIQTKAQQVDHLIATCESSLEDMCDMRPQYEASRKEAGERMSLFLDLSRHLAVEIAKLGEQIEVAQFDFIHAKAA